MLQTQIVSDFVLPPLEEDSQKIEPLVVTEESVDEDDEIQEDDTVLLSRATVKSLASSKSNCGSWSCFSCRSRLF